MEKVSNILEYGLGLESLKIGRVQVPKTLGFIVYFYYPIQLNSHLIITHNETNFATSLSGA